MCCDSRIFNVPKMEREGTAIMADQQYKLNFNPPPLDKADEDVVQRLFGESVVLSWRQGGTTDVYRLNLGRDLPPQSFIPKVITAFLLLTFGPTKSEAERDALRIINHWRAGTKSPSDKQ
jgi:hypothetical protein